MIRYPHGYFSGGYGKTDMPRPSRLPLGNLTTMYLRYITTAILTQERSEEEKERRRIFGDKGAKFKKGRIPKIDMGGVIGTVTTLVTKDLRIMEVYEERIWAIEKPGREREGGEAES